MSRSRKSKISHKLEENKDKFQKPIEQGDHDNSLLPMENNIKDSPIKNSNEPQTHPGHSTPMQKKYSKNNVEDSPGPCCNDSPISIPYTQDASEVAWDWQISSKASSVKNKTEDDHTVTTPKQAKILKKRILNSPLLYKPLRKRLIKPDSVESVGKFAAELKALTEKMKIIQRNDEDCIENDLDDNKDEVENHEEKDQLNELIVSNTNTFANKVSTSFDELFDESIEDSMVKCSQEIEEKFNLCTSKKISTSDSFKRSREKDTFITKEKSKSASNLSENLKSTFFSQNSPILNVSNFCKTYSKTTPNCKKNVDIDVKRLEVKESNVKQSSINNNIINNRNENLQLYKNLVRRNNAELFEIPDDSFDDCLATCIEDDKLLSETTEYDNIFPDSDIKQHANERNYKHSNSTNRNVTKSATKSNNFGCNSSSCINQTSMDTLNKSIHNSSVNSNLTENRKFFKTRSLSDSYFGHEKTTNINTKPNTSNSRQIIKHSSSSHLPSKSYVNISGRSTTNENVNANKNIKSINDVENMRALNNSKIMLKDSATRDMKNSQTMLCTPEEIERKRLEAKMRLEAKRKIHTNIKPAIPSELPPKKIQR
ncbi:PREDICTED: bromodomain-containing protein DDB_G0270170-like [Polistes dominula]|uniref:Bromodomain-containing protein DDB_G0270170-like n=1 Tax=Polistes dominula TaxID=743375 RepID=A0ABM1J5W3_POLDO|nr:PREDICTED: bromodomain-containing protein DDB_G0270170-like [Polistes dominula]XP_015187851.1 PREDICTED: bromodomain-containing protein DDB_G0270170-like [Polistes dominula]